LKQALFRFGLGNSADRSRSRSLGYVPDVRLDHEPNRAGQPTDWFWPMRFNGEISIRLPSWPVKYDLKPKHLTRPARFFVEARASECGWRRSISKPDAKDSCGQPLHQSRCQAPAGTVWQRAVAAPPPDRLPPCLRQPWAPSQLVAGPPVASRRTFSNESRCGTRADSACTRPFPGLVVIQRAKGFGFPCS